MTSPTNINEARFDTLLNSWNQHQELRKEHAPIASLAASRVRLDTARLDLRSAA